MYPLAEKIQVLHQRTVQCSIRTFLLCVFITAGIIRLAAVGLVGQIRSTAMYEPLRIAKNISEGYGFSLHWQYESEIPERQKFMKETPAPPYGTTFIPPLVPYCYSFVISAFGWNENTLTIIMIVQALMGSLLPMSVYYAARQFFNEESSRYSAILAVLYVPAAMTAITFSGSVIYSLLGSSILWGIGKIRQSTKYRYFIAFGLCAGLLSLTRSEWYYIFFAITGVLFLYKKTFFKHRYYSRGLLVSLMFFFLTTGWWTLRNYQEFGRIIPVTGHPWREMWRGFNPYSTGSGVNAQGLSIWEHRDEYTHIRKKLDSLPMNSTFEEKADDIYKTEVLTFWRQHPFTSLVLMIKKTVMLWTIDIYYDKSYHVFYIVPQLLSSTLIFFGFNTVRHDNKSLIIVWGTLFICVSGVFSLTYVLPRYQSYIFPMFFPLCGYAISILLCRINSHCKDVTTSITL